MKMLLLSFGTRHDRPKVKILLKLFFIKSLKFCDTRSPFATEKQEYLVFYASGELPFIKHPTETPDSSDICNGFTTCFTTLAEFSEKI